MGRQLRNCGSAGAGSSLVMAMTLLVVVQPGASAMPGCFSQCADQRIAATARGYASCGPTISKPWRRTRPRPASRTPAEGFGRLPGRHAALLEHALETSGREDGERTRALGLNPEGVHDAPRLPDLGAGTGDGLVVCHAMADLPLHHAALPPIGVLPKADIRRCAPHAFRSFPRRPDQAGSPATRVSMSMTSIVGISQAPTAAGTRSPRTGELPRGSPDPVLRN